MSRRSTTTSAFLVIGSMATLAGVGLGIAGGAVVWAHSTQRDSAGYYSTSAERLDTPTFALRSEEIDLGVDASSYRWIPGGPTAVQLQATSDRSTPVFVGIGRSADVERYLAGSAHSELTDFEVDPFRAEMRASGGTARPAPPLDQPFWAVSANGSGTQTVQWPVQSGEWTVVVMNADASPGVAVDVSVGAKTGVLLPVGIGLSALALAVFAGGVVLIVAGSSGSRGERRAAGGPVVGAQPAGPVPVPADVS